MKIALSTTFSFTLHIEFVGADVDVVFSEIGGPFQDSVIAHDNTPKQESVDRITGKIMMQDNPELTKLGAAVKECTDYMMGCCSFTVEVNELENVQQALDTATEIAKREYANVEYYENGTTVSPCSVQIITRR